MRCKKRCLALLLFSALLLTSCSLLPEEEAIRTAPVIRAYIRQEYHTLQVRLGDLEQRIEKVGNVIAEQELRYTPMRCSSGR